MSGVTFARWLFRFAGLYGILVLAPQFFLEAKIGADYPPAIQHVEYFYGFVGVGLAWQLAFLIIGHDPIRFRPIIIPSIVEKFSFAIAATVLFFQSRLPATIFIAGLIDLTLGVLFIVAWIRLGEKEIRP